MSAPTTYDVYIPLSPIAYLVSDGSAFRSGYMTSVLVDEQPVITISAKQFSQEPMARMGDLIDAIVAATPAHNVSDLPQKGKSIRFDNGTELRAWCDCVVVIRADSEEIAWSSDEWAVSGTEAEHVIGAFLNYLGQAVSE